MPLTTRRGSWLGRPVRGFSGGSSGSSRCHCASVTSKRLISPTWAGLPQSATLCRHALAERPLWAIMAPSLMVAPGRPFVHLLLHLADLGGKVVDHLVVDHLTDVILLTV